MSMHEIEDMVADAIRVIDAQGSGSQRDMIYALFDFQSGFDCSFTHGRVLDILVKHRFAYRFPLEEHPDYREHAKAFAEAAKDTKNICFVRSDIMGVEYDDEDEQPKVGHEDGYIADGMLYCDAGTPLWRQLVDAGKLSGADTKPPLKRPLPNVVADVMEAAIENGDDLLAAEWYALGPILLLNEQFRQPVKKGELFANNPFTGEPIYAAEDTEVMRPFSPAEAAALPIVQRIRALYWNSGAMKHELDDDIRPPPEMRGELEAWWWSEDVL